MEAPQSLPTPNPRGPHDTTPTAISCHLSQVMEIEQASNEEWLLSEPPALLSPGQS